MKKLLAGFLHLLLLSGCSTYYDPTDEYVRGIRWFDRGAFVQAKSSWEHLANAGDCDAQYRLGTLYFLGSGVQPNDETARQWWLSAANQGQAFAQNLLAVIHAHDTTAISTVARTVVFDCSQGCGVEKNMVEAYKWLSLSKRFAIYDGQQDRAQQVLAEYAQSMNAEQIAEAKQRAQDWKPSPNLCKQRKLL